MENSKPQQVLNIPTAILVAGAIIAISIIWTKSPTPTNQARSAANNNSFEQNIKLVTAEDHILGNPAAKIKIIEVEVKRG